MSTVRLDAAPFVDFDDCLAAAAGQYADEHGLAGWDLSPRWEDESRDVILLDVPDAPAPEAPPFARGTRIRLSAHHVAYVNHGRPNQDFAIARMRGTVVGHESQGVVLVAWDHCAHTIESVRPVATGNLEVV